MDSNPSLVHISLKITDMVFVMYFLYHFSCARVGKIFSEQSICRKCLNDYPFLAFSAILLAIFKGFCRNFSYQPLIQVLTLFFIDV